MALLATATGCGSQQPEPVPPARIEEPVAAPIAAAAAKAPAPVAPVQIEMKNVRLHLDDGLVLVVRHLRGEMVSNAVGEPPVFDRPDSYILRVFTGDIAIDMASLSVLMNRHVFGYADAPLKDLTVEIDDGRLKQHGKIRKGVWLPFSMKASVSTTPDGRLRLHTESVSALGIPATKLFDLFDVTVEDLMSIEKRRGVEVKDDDILIAPGRVLPPPEMRGWIARVDLANGAMRQVFARADGVQVPPLKPPDPAAANYIYFGGSIIRFGKLTMHDADLQLIDADPGDPFEFNPAQYDRQLVAGYSKNTPAKGLRTYMPDSTDLGRPAHRK
jgi:hypothetical protein